MSESAEHCPLASSCALECEFTSFPASLFSLCTRMQGTCVCGWSRVRECALEASARRSPLGRSRGKARERRQERRHAYATASTKLHIDILYACWMITVAMLHACRDGAISIHTRAPLELPSDARRLRLLVVERARTLLFALVAMLVYLGVFVVSSGLVSADSSTISERGDEDITRRCRQCSRCEC
jgi:hypothetical protein